MKHTIETIKDKLRTYKFTRTPDRLYSLEMEITALEAELRELLTLSMDDEKITEYKMCDDEGFNWRVIRIRELLGEEEP